MEDYVCCSCHRRGLRVVVIVGCVSHTPIIVIPVIVAIHVSKVSADFVKVAAAHENAQRFRWAVFVSRVSVCCAV